MGTIDDDDRVDEADLVHAVRVVDVPVIAALRTVLLQPALAAVALPPRPRIAAVAMCSFGDEDEAHEEEEEILENVPVDWDASLEWQRFMLEAALYEPEEMLQYRWQDFAGVFTATVCFLIILHACTLALRRNPFSR